MADTFEEMATEYQMTENNSGLEAGDECPDEECDKEMHELTHERDSQMDVMRHEDAPEHEIVCREHGVQASW